MRRYGVAMVCFGLLAWAGCGESGPEGGEKGSEEGAITGGKDDTFFNPTLHGAFDFTASNFADVSPNEKFHAWDFALSSDARVEVHTTSADTVDTVLYLLDADGVVVKDDDGGEGVFSRFDRELVAGEYRVVVKGFSSNAAGLVEVLGTCSGEGCGASVGSTRLDCTGATSFMIPKANQMTEECLVAAQGYAQSTNKGAGVVGHTGFTYDERCDVGLEWWEELAIDMFVNYIDQSESMEAMEARLNDAEPFRFETAKLEKQDGSMLVSVSIGKTGNAVDARVIGEFLWDANLGLLAWDVLEFDPAANQNTVLAGEYTCELFSDGTVSAGVGPDPTCTKSSFWLGAHDGWQSSDGTVAVSDIGTLPALAATALDEFAFTWALAPDAQISYVAETWFDDQGTFLIESGENVTTYNLAFDIATFRHQVVFSDDLWACYPPISDRDGNFDSAVEVEGHVIPADLMLGTVIGVWADANPIRLGISTPAEAAGINAKMALYEFDGANLGRLVAETNTFALTGTRQEVEIVRDSGAFTIPRGDYFVFVRLEREATVFGDGTSTLSSLQFELGFDEVAPDGPSAGAAAVEAPRLAMWLVNSEFL